MKQKTEQKIEKEKSLEEIKKLIDRSLTLVRTIGEKKYKIIRVSRKKYIKGDWEWRSILNRFVILINEDTDELLIY
jgi:hypothetical protein